MIKLRDLRRGFRCNVVKMLACFWSPFIQHEELVPFILIMVIARLSEKFTHAFLLILGIKLPELQFDIAFILLCIQSLAVISKGNQRYHRMNLSQE